MSDVQIARKVAARHVRRLVAYGGYTDVEQLQGLRTFTSPAPTEDRRDEEEEATAAPPKPSEINYDGDVSINRPNVPTDAVP